MELRKRYLLAIWSVPPLALTASLALRPGGSAFPWPDFLVSQLWQWWPWAPLSLGVAAWRRRWPLSVERYESLRRTLAMHGLMALAMGLALTTLLIGIEVFPLPTGISIADLLRRLPYTVFVILLLQTTIYSLVLAVLEVAALYRSDRRREQSLTQARLQALRLQLQPHFLFNSLHAVASLMDEDVDAARRMIARLSDLLRASLDESRSQVALEEEIDLARLYLAIEEVRFQDRLRVTWKVSPEVLRAATPHLLLQPLLENAVRHGLGGRADAGQLEVHARRQGADLEVQIDDDGPGPSDPETSASGIGLSNTRKRLEALYGERARVELSARPGQGARVVARWPYSEVATEVAE